MWAEEFVLCNTTGSVEEQRWWSESAAAASTLSHGADAPLPKESCFKAENWAEFKALVDLGCFSAADFLNTASLLSFFGTFKIFTAIDLGKGVEEG